MSTGGGITLGVGSSPGPTASGWYAVRMSSGIVAIVRRDAGQWQWGGINTSSFGTVSSWHYLGSNVSGITGLQNLETLIRATGSQMRAAVDAFDHGTLGLNGQPIAINPDGSIAGSKTAFGDIHHSDVQSQNALFTNVSAPSVGVGSLLGFLTSASNWARLGLVILGALLTLLGLRALTGGEGNPVTVIQRTVKRAR